MNPEEPGIGLGGRRWLIVAGVLAVAVAMFWVRSRNTKTVTFRFIDGNTRQPVTNVVLTSSRSRHSFYPDWLLEQFPDLPREVRNVGRSVVCSSDTITASIRADAGEDAAIDFSAANYVATGFVYCGDDPMDSFRLIYYSNKPPVRRYPYFRTSTTFVTVPLWPQR